MDKKGLKDDQFIFLGILGTGKGSWNHVDHLITAADWKELYIVGNEFASTKFYTASNRKIKWIEINDYIGFFSLKETIAAQLPPADEGPLAVNLQSGSGKIHMALICALREENRHYKLVTIVSGGQLYYF